jgi:hypothetical protein
VMHTTHVRIFTFPAFSCQISHSNLFLLPICEPAQKIPA